MQRWEYLQIYRYGSKHVLEINGQDVSKQKLEVYSYLNKLGDEGWEFFAVDGAYYFLERPKE